MVSYYIEQIPFIATFYILPDDAHYITVTVKHSKPAQPLEL